MPRRSPNDNHPPKGSRIAVEPIRDEKAIQSIKRLLSNKPRDLLLFTLGINNGLRISDLLALKVGQVRGLKPGQSITVREQKTGKSNVLMMNRTSHKALERYLAEARPGDYEYLFKSQKGENKPITVSYANGLMKSWAKALNLKGNYGTHSLRKTFGYIQRTKYGVAWELLAKRFGHSSPSTTLRYLGLTDHEVNGILLNEI